MGFRLAGARLAAAPLAGLPPAAPLGRPANGLPTAGDVSAGGDAPAFRAPLLDRKTAALSAGIVAAVPVIGWFTWWADEKKTSFHFANEGWFGRTAVAGGADKAAHFVVSAMLEDAGEAIYRSLGKDERQARLLGFGLATLGGLVIETGDGFTDYGASWEDLTANVLGALAAAELKRTGWDDTVGFRLGLVRKRIPDPCCRSNGHGGDYSKWVHSADLKLNGLLPRLGIQPGPARFLLVSFTYGTKGYRFSPVEVRERNVGVDLGLNVEEVLRAVGVPPGKWWGKALLAFVRYYRLPWTAFGWRYDLNSGRWHGPDTGDVFDPGAVIYD